MMLALYLFGPPRLELDGEALHIPRRKALALLIYLTVERDRSHRRETLFTLLWPGMPEKSARKNLRQTLYALRQDFPDLEDPHGDLVPLLLVDRQTVQLNPTRELTVDIHQLDNALASTQTHDHPNLAGCSTCTAALEEALALYQADFLADFYLQDSNPYEEWVEAVRETYRHKLIDILITSSDIRKQNRDYQGALAYIDRLLALNDLSERAHRQKIEVLARSGRRVEAMRQYRNFAKYLQEQLKTAPSQETTALYEWIRSEELAAALPRPGSTTPKTTLPRHNLPTQPTPFIGREKELAELDALITDPETRLVTIVGPGGMGKTRLALVATEQVLEREQFPDGIFFINFAPLSEPSQIIPAMIETLDFYLHRQDDRSPQQQLLDYLRPKKLFLLLDNCEHLLDGVDLVAKILQTAPEVQILATSRERLHLWTEQVYLIEGLEFPETVLKKSLGTPEDVVEFTAVQLFLQSARRNQPDFTLRDGDDFTYLSHICRMVAGMPLALELTASWVDTLPLNEIATGLQEGLDFLETDMRDIPERHHSIRATIDHSWGKLDDQTRDIFAKLSVFRGGFTRQAAQAVAGANLHQLGRLVNKSFLQYAQASDRYQVHELMRQYGAEKLAERCEETVVRNQHSSYYCQQLGEKEPELKGPRQRITLAEFEADIDNIEAAWRWALQHRLWSNLQQTGHTLYWFHLLAKRTPKSLALFQLTVNQFAPSNLTGVDDKDTALVLARVFIWLAGYYNYSGQEHQAETLMQKSQALLQSQRLAQEETQRDEALFYYIKAEIAFPNQKDALGFTQKSLALTRASGDQWQEIQTLRQLGYTLGELSNYEMAQKSFNEALVLSRTLNSPFAMADLLREMGSVAGNMMDYQQSETLYQESLALARSQSDIPRITMALSCLGFLKMYLGEFERSVDYFQQAVGVGWEYGHPNDTVENWDALATANIFLGHFTLAKQCIEEGLAWVEIDDSSTLPQDMLADQARMNIWMGRYKAAQIDIDRLFSAYGESDNIGFWWHSPYGPSGWLSLAQSNFALAKENLQKAVESIRQFGSSGEQAWSAIFQATLSRAEWSLGQHATARQHLLEALAVAVKIRAFITLLHVLPIVPVLLAGEDDICQKVRAIEIYALAHSHPFIANSPFFYAIAGMHIEEIEADLPADTVSAAKARGRALDFWPTGEKLLEELEELGWGNAEISQICDS